MRKIMLLITLLVSGFVAGCATTSKLPSPKLMEASNEFYSASATTNCDSDGCKTFNLTVVNKSAKDIKIDWNKTAFISHGQTSGGFWFEGIVIRDRNMPKPQEVIFASGSYKKTVAPNLSMDLSMFPLAHWKINPMPAGEGGIYIVIDVDGKEVPLRMTTQIHDDN